MVANGAELNGFDAAAMGDVARLQHLLAADPALDELAQRKLGSLSGELKPVEDLARRALLFDPRASEGFAYYDDSAWGISRWVGGFTSRRRRRW